MTERTLLRPLEAFDASVEGLDLTKPTDLLTLMTTTLGLVVAQLTTAGHWAAAADLARLARELYDAQREHSTALVTISLKVPTAS